MNISSTKESLSPLPINLCLTVRSTFAAAPNPAVPHIDASMVVSENVNLVHIAVYFL